MEIGEASFHAALMDAREEKNCVSSAIEMIQEDKVSSRPKQKKAQKKENGLVSDSEMVQEAVMCLPEDRLQEVRDTPIHQPGPTAKETTAGQRKGKAKTTTLQPETGVTTGSRKSKGAASAISPKSTRFTPRATTPESLSPRARKTQTELAAEADEDSAKNAGEWKVHLKEGKNKRDVKQVHKTGFEKDSVRIFEDDDVPNSRIPDASLGSTKQKKTKGPKDSEDEQIVSTNSQKSSTIKQKGHETHVGKHPPEEVERKDRPEDKSKQPVRREQVHTTSREDPHIEHLNSQEDSGHVRNAEKDSNITEEEETNDDHLTSAHSRSLRSHTTTITNHSSRRDSHTTHDASSVARTSYSRTSSPSGPSVILMPPQSPHHVLSEPVRSIPVSTGSVVKSSETPTNQTDRRAASLVEKAERRRLEVEKKRKEKDVDKRRRQEKEAIEERIRLELEEEQRTRAEEAKLQKIREEEEIQKREEEESEKQRKEMAEKEVEIRRQVEKKRLMERLRRERQEVEERQSAEFHRQKKEEEEERRMLSEMEESERLQHLRRQQEDEEERRKAIQERRRREEEEAMCAEEEAKLQAERLVRQGAALQRRLMFRQSLYVEAGGLEQAHDVSRPWTFSYFSLLKMLGLDEA